MKNTIISMAVGIAIGLTLFSQFDKVYMEGMYVDSDIKKMLSDEQISALIDAKLGACPRIEVVARESCFESDFSNI